MPESGLFITMNSEDSLAYCLETGVFGSYMSTNPRTNVHYKTLADYACARKGMHVFFFHRKQIIYGGRVVSESDGDGAAFIINGDFGAGLVIIF